MEKPKVDKPCSGSEDGAQLTRNRSFKSKQLVRSQAIRESHSPPRTSSPYPSSPVGDPKGDGKQPRENGAKDDRERPEEKRQPVEIQISSSWDGDATEQRQRTQRWLGNRHHSDSSRDLLSNNPRLACVCGACECHRCRGQRRKHDCPVKQDSGIACSVDCPDCGYEYANANGDEAREPGSFDDQRKSGSFDDQTSYCRCPPQRTTRQDRPRNYSFTRSDSDIAEPSWVELVSFIQTTLNKNPRDRATMLKIEKDLHAFVNDAGRCVVRFPVMTSYGRMLVHRCAALFQLAHRLDTVHKNTVVVSKNGTSGGRIPCTSFRQWCTATFPRSPPRADDTSAKSILKRSCFGEETPPAANGSARSLEEREREYELVRRRIFSTGGAPDAEWPWLPAGPVRLLAPEPGRNKLIKVQSLESRGGEGGARAPVAKSHSLDGYGNAHQPRLLSRHGDLASSSWRVSPSSSGYKTLSLRSTDSVTPSPTGCASPEGAVGAEARAPAGDACAGGAAGAGGGAVVWCVTDMADVPPGALVIHPQTGRPLTHPDGSVYHFDPANPPVVRDDTLCLQNGAQDANNENRRGRLEKQHSFIDNESEYPSVEYDVKCCGDCPDQEICTKCPAETIPSPQSSKPNSIPASPAKRIEPTPETTNQRPAYENPTNQKPPIENTTNQYSPSRRPNYNRYDNRLRYDQVTHQVDQNNKPDVMANNSQPSDVTNQRPVVEVTANQRQVEQVSTNQSQDSGQRQYESQRVEQQRVYEQANVREVVPYVQNYTQYRNDEMTSPPQLAGAYAAEASEHALIAQKMAPVPAPDPTMRPMSIAATVMYPAMHQAYPYVNPCRMEQPMQPMYQPLVQQMLPQVLQHMVPCEEQKHMAPSPHQDTTFRIDPSYPYATDFNAACGACADPSVLQHQQRSVSVGYGQVEMQPTVVPQPYPLHGMVPSAQPYPYQEAVQWQPVGPLVGGGVGVGGACAPQKLILPEAMYPLLCPNVYQPYNMLYPQVIPQPYPICPPVYPVVDKQPEPYRAFPHRQFKRASASGSSRATPQTPEEAKRTPYEEKSREVARDAVSRDGSGRDVNREANRDTSSPSHNTEIAVTIAQIKEQLALSTRAREPAGGGRARDDWRRRSCGGGLLGSCPAQPYVRLQGRPNEEAQINPAIYNSIRNMQAKQNYQHQQERRMYELGTQYRAADARFDGRRPRGDRADVHDARAPRGAFRPELRQRGVGVPLPLRAPYVFRQVTPNTWSRRSPGMIPPIMNHPRRPHPDRNPRR